MYSKGLTPTGIDTVVGKYSKLLVVPLGTVLSVETWLCGKFGWDQAQICKTLTKFPQKFRLRVETCLAPHLLLWFTSQGSARKASANVC